MADEIFAALLTPLALAILVSGLDDLVIDVSWLLSWSGCALDRCLERIATSRGGSRVPRVPDASSRARMHAMPSDAELSAMPPRPIAILAPLWHEHEVIRGMLDHNLAACNYPSVHFFPACYPNDDPTIDAVRAVEAREPRVHLCLCPHDGPTSKADCLNWAFQRLLLWEECNGVRFDVIMIHDAEDLIHPESLRYVNYYSERFDMVQVPVLALPTPLREPVHGLYCDEFAEYQTRDMRVRGWMGAFVPSTGVGTGIRRDAVEKLAAAHANQLFPPESLTEDYELGLRLKALGCSQICIPVSWRDGSLVATREYFPRRWRAALRQRTRWITGICLQTWQRHGWTARPVDAYWMWRDRKGLVAHPLGLLSNGMTAYGLFHWNLVASASPTAHRALAATLCIQIIRLAVRFCFVARIYGIRFATGVPVRFLLGNALNTAATANAVARFTWASLRRRPLRWLKTEHAYPTRVALAMHKRRLGEVLAGSGYTTRSVIDAALSRPPDGLRLGEFLLAEGAVEEEALYEALCLQHGLPAGPSWPRQVNASSMRLLPSHVAEAWRLLPFEIEQGRLRIALDDLPSDELVSILARYTRLEPEFHLLPPARLAALRSVLAQKSLKD
ncbi:MAG: glycosyl transferase family protein [Bryobacteraceae bacterium]